MNAKIYFTGLGCYIYYRGISAYEPSPSAATKFYNYLNS